jgi:hypothetical protein
MTAAPVRNGIAKKRRSDLRAAVATLPRIEASVFQSGCDGGKQRRQNRGTGACGETGAGAVIRFQSKISRRC